MIQVFYDLWHMRYDEEGQDHDKLLGIYSTQERAEQAFALLRNKPGFCDHSDGFEINEGPLDETWFTDGFVTVWGDEEPDDEAFKKPPVRLILPGRSKDGLSFNRKMKYYVLWLRYIDDDGYDHELTPGTYSTRENAQHALAFLSDKLGFRDHPDGFEISEGVVDKTYFANGFVAAQGRGARDVEAGPAPQRKCG
jgi:hypothetical protein